MASNTQDFFLEIASQRTYSQMRGVTGTGRFVIPGVGIWHMTITDGDVLVSQQDTPADVTITCDGSVFDRMVRGEADMVVLAMQHQIQIVGNLGLAAILNRLLPPEIHRAPQAPPPIPEHPVAASQPATKTTVPASEQQVIPQQMVSVLEGNTFVMSDRSGNIDASPTDTQGLFTWDTRYLSRWQLTINGIVPRPLSIDDLQYYAVQFFLVPTTGTVYVDAKLSVIRTRVVGNGFQETITVLSHANEPVDLDVHLEVGADFADTFEVKDALAKQGKYDQRIEDHRLVLAYQREHFRRETWIETDALARIDGHSVSYQVHIEPHAEWSTTLNVLTANTRIGDTSQVVSAPKTVMRQNLVEWLAAAPRVSCQWDQVEQIYQRSLVDLAALRFYPQILPDMALPAALGWIDQYGDRNGDGFVDYNRRNTETGLENQCWKDSWDSILFADGTLSTLPRATCEIQGYVYDAKRRCARLARQFWNDPALADRLDQEAAALKERFNREYWLADRGYYALALNGDGRKVDALTSNIGHLLWSGIADDDKAAACVRHLMGERLFSEWGVRTMAEGDGGYNPIGYHVGTVWPHDNAIIALGLTRYGYRQEAAQITMGMLQAATYFHHRLPEAFAGYPRGRTDYPVEYPTACSPQAWATGAPLMLLQAVLGLEPVAGRLLVNPHLPAEMGWLGMFDIPGRWGRMDAFARAKGTEQDYLPPLVTRELHGARR